MNLLYTLGAIGGILVGIDVLAEFVRLFKAWYRKYRRMMACYERNRNKDEKPPMGFMTEKEREEIKDRLMSGGRA